MYLIGRKLESVKIAEEWNKLKDAQRIVVKVGTSTLTHQTGTLNLLRMEQLVRQLVDVKNQGREILLVTSAAVGAGMGRLSMKKKPEAIADRQALAAIGQGILMHIYEKFFGEYGVTVAQVLLTKDDLADRQRYLNARTTMHRIMGFGAVPIINENDTVAFDQIRFGDNDTLSAMVAGLVDADLLVILSDIEGLYTGDPRENQHAELIPIVEDITPEIESLAGGAGSTLGSGGMKTKIAAARIAVSQGIPMVLAKGSHRSCLGFLSDDEIGQGQEQSFSGTLFLPKQSSLGNRKGWLAFSTRPAGAVVIDKGASKAILENGKSLLPSGIQQIEGSFSRGDVVELIYDSEIIARGIVNFSSDDITQIMGRHSSEVESILGPGYSQEVIHRDNLSPWK